MMEEILAVYVRTCLHRLPCSRKIYPLSFKSVEALERRFVLPTFCNTLGVTL